MRILAKIAFAVAAAPFAAGVSAQEMCRVTSSSGATQERDGTLTLSFSLENAPYFQYIVNAPFSATYETSVGYVTSSGKTVEVTNPSEHWFRDAFGRQRRDHESFFGTHFTDICDPVARVAYLLDPENRVAHRIMFEPREPRTPSRERIIPNSGPHRQIEDLGERSIEGVFVQGIRQKTSTGRPDGTEAVSTAESWKCADLDVKVLEVTKDPSGNTRTFRVKQIIASDPSPALFQVPSNFRVVDESRSFVISVPKPQRSNPQY